MPKTTTSAPKRSETKPEIAATLALADRLPFSQAVSEDTTISPEAAQALIQSISAPLQLMYSQGEAQQPALQVVKILLELAMPQAVVDAGFLAIAWRSSTLHKDVETLATPEVINILKDLDAIAVIDVLHEKDNQDVERLRKMLLAVVNDVRVVVLKLALQLVAMRQLDQADTAKQTRLALQTRDIFAPLANRLGIAKVKWELEDLALRALEPTTYQLIVSFLSEQRRTRESYIARIIDKLKQTLKGEGITEITCYGRAKHINSIYAKMKRKHKRLEEIYDLLALRIHVPSLESCYAVLSVVHSLWQPIDSEFDDYIANPKANGYQSLHTAVMGPEGKVIEIQIRTNEMHDYAELGVAAHWRYKENLTGAQSTFDRQINWLRQLLDSKNEHADEELLEAFKSEIKEDRVYVVTPQGQVIDLLDGSTPLDFAYHIHTELGHRTRGAIVNGVMVPTTHVLKTGDQVEILTGAKDQPSRDWLNKNAGYLKTPRARAKVRGFFKKLQKERAIEEGRVLFETAIAKSTNKTGVKSMERSDKSPDKSSDKWLEKLDKPSDKLISQAIQKFNFKTLEDLYAAIGFGDLTLLQVWHFFAQNQPRPQQPNDNIETRLARIPLKRRKHIPHQVLIEGVSDLLISMASCCTPIAPEPIAGFITKTRGVSIHQQNCVNLLALQKQEPDKVLPVTWCDEDEAFVSSISIRAYDRAGLIQDVMQTLSNAHIETYQAAFDADEDGIATLRLQISVRDLQQLKSAMDKIRPLRSVINVTR